MEFQQLVCLEMKARLGQDQNQDSDLLLRSEGFASLFSFPGYEYSTEMQEDFQLEFLKFSLVKKFPF